MRPTVWSVLGSLLFGASLVIVLRGGSGATAVVLATLSLVVFGVAAWEHGPNGAREIALVASYAATAAAGRVLFVAIPSVQPVTIMTACAGAALGPRAGAAVGALAALVSNGFLGQGPWTPWEMLGWGLVGGSAGMCGRLLRRRSALVSFGVVWGFAYGPCSTCRCSRPSAPPDVGGLPGDRAARPPVRRGPRDRQRRDRAGGGPGARSAARALRTAPRRQIVWDEPDPEPGSALTGAA